MSKQKEILLQWLIDVEQVLAAIGTITSVAGDYYSVILARIQNLKATCSEQDETLAHSSDHSLENEQNSLKQSIGMLIFHQLQSSAEEYSLNVQTSQEAITAILEDNPAINIQPIIAQYNHQIREVNAQNLERLQRIKEKLRPNQSVSLNNLDEMISKISKNPDQLLVKQTEINKLDSTKKTRVKRSIPQIKTMPNEAILAIHQRTEFETLVLQSQDYLAMEDTLFNNVPKDILKEVKAEFLIKKYLVELRTDIELLTSLLNRPSTPGFTRETISESPSSSSSLLKGFNHWFDGGEKSIPITEEHKELAIENQDDLSITIKQIHEQITRIESIKNRVNQKLQWLTSDKPEDILAQARHNLRKVLEEFVLNVITIDIDNKRDLDSQQFKEPLVKFILELNDELRNSNMPLVTKKITELHNRLLQHLAEATNFLEKAWSKLPNNQLTPIPLLNSEVDAILFGLFDYNPSKKPGVTDILKQIVALNHVTEKLSAFPIKRSSNYFALRNTEVEHDKTIYNRYAKIRKKINEQSLRLFSKIEPLDHEFSHCEEARKGSKAHQGLTLALRTIKAQVKSYAVERVNLLTISCPLERLEKITALQEQTIKEINHQYSELEKIGPDREDSPCTSSTEHLASSSSKNSLLQVSNKRESHQENNHVFAGIDACISELDRKYSFERSLILYNLNQALDEATIAMDIHQARNQVLATLKPQIKQLETLRGRAESFSLFRLKEETIPAINQLKKEVTRVKSRIKFDNLAAVTELRTYDSQMQVPILRNLNPFKPDVLVHIPRVKECRRNMDVAYNDIDTCSAPTLKACKIRLETCIGEMDDKITLLNTTLQNAQIIENRLISDAYRTSVRVINNLQSEFCRIVRHHIAETRLRFPDNQNLIDLQNRTINEANDLNQDLGNYSNELIGLIDPRLAKLKNMHSAFVAINNNYISVNINHYSEQSYVQALKDEVERQIILNPNMEDLSDGKRSHFVQWIRKNIFKPIQSLNHRVSLLFKPATDNANRFFTTAGACYTERRVVETGNTVYGELNQIQSSTVA